MWNREEITGINGYLFDSPKIFCARRAFPEGSKRMYCFDLAATALFFHSDFHLQLTFIWTETCSWQHLSPCVCGYSKSRVIQELNYHVCFPLFCLWTELRSGRRKILRSKNDHASTLQIGWSYLEKHPISSNQRLKTKATIHIQTRETMRMHLSLESTKIHTRQSFTQFMLWSLSEEGAKWVAVFQPQEAEQTSFIHVCASPLVTTRKHICTSDSCLFSEHSLAGHYHKSS